MHRKRRSSAPGVPRHRRQFRKGGVSDLCVDSGAGLVAQGHATGSSATLTVTSRPALIAPPRPRPTGELWHLPVNPSNTGERRCSGSACSRLRPPQLPRLRVRRFVRRGRGSSEGHLAPERAAGRQLDRRRPERRRGANTGRPIPLHRRPLPVERHKARPTHRNDPRHRNDHLTHDRLLHGDDVSARRADPGRRLLRLHRARRDDHRARWHRAVQQRRWRVSRSRRSAARTPTIHRSSFVSFNSAGRRPQRTTVA